MNSIYEDYTEENIRKYVLDSDNRRKTITAISDITGYSFEEICEIAEITNLQTLDISPSLAFYRRHRERILEDKKTYYALNREKRLAYTREYRAKNREALNAKAKEYNRNHSDERAAYSKAYYRANRERIRAKQNERNARKRAEAANASQAKEKPV